MKTTIVNFYIEITEPQVQENLERLLMLANYPFYDATKYDFYTRKGTFSTLEEIEADIEGK